MIFCSNEDQIFGYGSLGSADELWSSSKDVTSSPERSIPQSDDSPRLELGTLRSTSEQLSVQGEYLSDRSHCFTPGYDNKKLLTSSVLRDINSCAGNVEYDGSNSKISVAEKVM